MAAAILPAPARARDPRNPAEACAGAPAWPQRPFAHRHDREAQALITARRAAYAAHGRALLGPCSRS